MAGMDALGKRRPPAPERVTTEEVYSLARRSGLSDAFQLSDFNDH